MTNVVPFERQVVRRHARLTAGELVSFKTPDEIVAFTGYEIQHSKMNYTAIAKAAGVCHSTVSNIVHGQTRSPHLRTAMAILQVLGFEIVVRK